MKKVGKIGKQNIQANRKIKEMFIDKGITFCEVKLDGCTPDYALTFAHRHKRVWYHSKMHLLSEYTQVVCACMSCHMKIEKDKNLTELIFQKLRGDEKYV